jgi:hypothetical protein
MFDATPSDAAGYVFAAYLFFLLMVLVYISILGTKFQRINRELGELIDELKAEDEEKADQETAAEAPSREESSV